MADVAAGTPASNATTASGETASAAPEPGLRAQPQQVPPWLEGVPLEDGPDAPGVGPGSPVVRGSGIWSGSRVYGLQMHVHGTVSEGTGTPQWHLDEAEAQGIDVIWWTDHDVMYHPGDTHQVTGDGFESGTTEFEVTTWPSTESETAAWIEDSSSVADYTWSATSEAALRGSYGGRLQVEGDASAGDQQVSMYLRVNPRVNFEPLLAQVELDLAWRPVAIDGDVEFRIVVPLSATTVSETTDRVDSDDYKLVLYWNNTGVTYDDVDDGLTVYRQLGDPAWDGSTGEWVEESLDLTGEITASLGEDAYGLHAEMITVQVMVSGDATATFDVDEIGWSSRLRGNHLKRAQASYLASLDTPLVQHVGVEVSAVGGRHFNAYGDRVPFLPYSDNDELNGSDVADWIHFNNGMMSWNHMFGVSMGIDDEDTRAAMVEDAIDEIIEREGYGADLLEVGYRSRRGETEDFLEVWDAASMEGIIMTGIGTNDLHDRKDWDGWANRYITWVSAPNAGEARLMLALISGRAWFGDPALFPMGEAVVELAVPSLGMRMGQGAVGVTGTQTAIFRADWVDEGWEIRAVENGVVVASWTSDGAGSYEVGHDFEPEGGMVLRFEVWDDTGAGAVFTNPLYFRDDDDGVIPDWRLVP